MTSRHESNASSSSTGTAFTGSLQAKKKAELQEIATALSLSDTGTRDELQQRIKKHLDDNTTDLEDDPAFSGLYASRRRQRSAQPQLAPAGLKSSTSLSAMSAIEEQREVTPPADDLRDVSMMLPPAPVSPRSPTSYRSSHLGDLPTPSSLPPLPPSPSKSILEDALAQPEVQAVVEMERNVVRGSTRILSQTRAMLSSAKNIFVITAIFDLFSILLTIHNDAPFPIPPITVQAPPTLNAMALAATHWALPTVVLPAVLGYLISFVSPSPARSSTSPFDPLTASIVRLASTVAYPFPHIRLSTAATETYTLDVLGKNKRVFTASVTLAFAFAEAIGRSGPTLDTVADTSH